MILTAKMRSSAGGYAIFLIILFIITLSACQNRTVTPPSSGGDDKVASPDASGPLRHVRLLPYWVPSAQFAGYYVGIEQGIFKKHGIDLEILTFDAQLKPEELIGTGKTDFAMLWLVNAIGVRNQGADIVNIAQFSSRSSLMLITKKSSGIARIEDMNGKRAGIWIGYEKPPQALFKKYNLQVEMVPIGSTNNLFLKDGVDILNANWFDEYHSVLNNGINEDELNKFFFADYGLNFLEDGIYCLADKRKNDPELCRDFVEAVIESWTWAFEHQEAAVEAVVKYARSMNQPVNKPHQRWMLSCYKELYIPAGQTTIHNNLKQQDYEAVLQIMQESSLLNQPTPYSSFYKPATGK